MGKSIQPKLELFGPLWAPPIARSAGRSHTGPMASLPAQLTSFVGRTSTIELVGRRLAEHRLVSLVGPGGCGKTRLAIEVALQTMGTAQDGAVQDCTVFVDFSGLSDPALVPGGVTRAIGLPEVAGQDPLETLSVQLSKRDLLLILDNCEHLIGACAVLAGALVRNCPGVRLLATSRERLGIPGEAVVLVGGLELPEGAGPWRERGVERSEAGRLFIDRARMARADFAVDDLGALGAICEDLDGMPLAIELAAARVSLMSLKAIAEALSNRFGLLVGSGRAGPVRHQTLQASVEWSCSLLSEDERKLLHHLSVFASGFTLAAATAVASCSEIEPCVVLRLLTSLVDKSLVQALPNADRFRLHETTRAYAAAALEATGLTRQFRDRHLRYFTTLAQEMEPKALTSEYPVALATLRPDLDNLRSALDWAVESQQFEAGAELLSSAGLFFDLIGIYSEALARCEQLLAGDLGPRRRADVLYWASAYVRTDPAVSLSFASDLIELGRLLGDDSVLARGLCRAAFSNVFAKPDEGQRIAEEAARLAQATGQHNMLVKSLTSEAWAFWGLGRPQAAFPLAEKAVELAQEFDLPWEEAWARLVLSEAARWTGRLERSLAEAQVALGLSAKIPSLFAFYGEGFCGAAYMYLGDSRASEALARACREAEATGHWAHAAAFGCEYGHLLIRLGQQDEGYELIEAGTVKLEAIGRARTCVDSRAILAEVAVKRGDMTTARLHLELAANQVPDMTEPAAVPVLRAKARLARAEGELHRAHGLACDGLGAALSGGHLPRAIDLLELVAVTVADLGQVDEAARLLGAAERQRELTKYARSAPARDELGPVLTKIEEARGKESFEQALSEGRALSLEEAVAYACRGRGSRRRAVSGWDSLTASERRVANLVGQYLSNAEISERLFVSTTTVKSHLNRVFTKLGVNSRAQLAAVVHGRDAPSV